MAASSPCVPLKKNWSSSCPPDFELTASAQILKTFPSGLAAGQSVPTLITSAPPAPARDARAISTTEATRSRRKAHLRRRTLGGRSPRRHRRRSRALSAHATQWSSPEGLGGGHIP